MKNAFAIVTLSALMATYAMAQTPVAPADAAASPTAPAPAAPQEPDATSKEGAGGDELPKVELSSDLLYKLTKAEMETLNDRLRTLQAKKGYAIPKGMDPNRPQKISRRAMRGR